MSNGLVPQLSFAWLYDPECWICLPIFLKYSCYKAVELPPRGPYGPISLSAVHCTCATLLNCKHVQTTSHLQRQVCSTYSRGYSGRIAE